MTDSEQRMEDLIFSKCHKKDGTANTCKFCGQHVWWHKIEGRWYEPGGADLHSPNCQRSTDHYRHKSLDSAEKARQARGEK